MNTDEQWMSHALQMATEAKADGEFPFGAILIKDGKMIAQGRCRENHLSTVLAHAEAESIDAACKALGTTKLTDCTIYSAPTSPA